MEKSMMGFLENTELLTKEGVLSLSPLVLAFIGDAVYSLYIRTKIVAQKKSAC